jgi:hypothetical protein
LERSVTPLFEDLLDLYTHSKEDATADAVRAEMLAGLQCLARALVSSGAELMYAVKAAEEQS